MQLGGRMAEDEDEPNFRDDAMAYLKTVKDTFPDETEKFQAFLRIMTDFSTQRIDSVGTIERVKALFEGHRDLILGFNTFLPEGLKITLPPEDEEPRALEKGGPSGMGKSARDEAILLFRKIKNRFRSHGQSHAYDMLIYILKGYGKGVPFHEITKAISVLFKGHGDLHTEFRQFLFDSPAYDSIQAPGAPYSISLEKHMERCTIKIPPEGKGKEIIDYTIESSEESSSSSSSDSDSSSNSDSDSGSGSGSGSGSNSDSDGSE